MTKEGLFFVISAPSGTGKTSLCQEIIRIVSNLHYSVSYTTRPPRPGEKNEKDYYFVSEEEFREMIKEDKFAEWTEIYGYLYGTLLDDVLKAKNEGIDLILDLDGQGAQRMKEIYPNVISIFLLPPGIANLEKRLAKRGTEAEAGARRRLLEAKEEIAKATFYDYIVINDDFEEAIERLKSIIIAERCKKERVWPQQSKWREEWLELR